MLLRVIDTETTGIPDEDDGHALVEVGCCDIVDGVVGTPRSMLVNPRRPISVGAMATHHITDDDVENAPPIDAGLKMLMEGNPDYFFAHKAEFDEQFFGAGGATIICTWKAALRLYPDSERHTNQYLRYELGLDVDRVLADPPHRAGADAYVTAHLLHRMFDDGASIEDMLRWSKGHPLFPKIGFGKHFGKRWEDVDIGYLNWIIGTEDMDPAVKANARHHLKLRGR
ncbi:exonuclease domain-containing protein [Microvirga brassicacearum]|nr:exonuclease domain-containing protein [Microvirga brassicacearum]